MSKLERVELLLIAPAGVGWAWSISVLSPMDISSLDLSLGHWVLWASALLLFQTLIRDLWLMRRKPRAGESVSSRGIRSINRPVDPPVDPPVDKGSGRLMCIESSLGMVGVVIGAGLFLSGLGGRIELGFGSVVLLGWLVLVGGFLIKDWVIDATDGLRFRRDPDHRNIVVRWRR